MDEVTTAAPAAPAMTEAPAAPAASVPVAPAGESVSSSPATTSLPTEAASISSEPIASPSAAEAAARPANEFQPSLLDSATQTESPKPSEGTSEAKPADGKTDAPGETPPAPIKYEFTYPEGFDSSAVNSERMSAYTGILGEAKVAPEVGQKLLDMHLSELNHATETIQQRQWDVFNETQNRWRKEVMADPELGGANHQEALHTIMSFIDQYGGTAAERAALLESGKITGWANNPAVLRLLNRAGKALSREGVPHPAPPPRSAPTDPRQRRMSVRYGTTTPPG